MAEIYHCNIGTPTAKEASKELFIQGIDKLVEHFEKVRALADGNWTTENLKGKPFKVEFTKEEVEKQMESKGSAFFICTGVTSFWVNIHSVELIK